MYFTCHISDDLQKLGPGQIDLDKFWSPFLSNWLRFDSNEKWCQCVLPATFPRNYCMLNRPRTFSICHISVTIEDTDVSLCITYHISDDLEKCLDCCLFQPVQYEINSLFVQISMCDWVCVNAFMSVYVYEWLYVYGWFVSLHCLCPVCPACACSCDDLKRVSNWLHVCVSCVSGMWAPGFVFMCFALHEHCAVHVYSRMHVNSKMHILVQY